MGSPGILAQQEAIAAQLGRMLAALPEELLRAPGGEGDWNVAQAFAHTTAARRFLGTWAALDAGGTWPEDDAPVVTPSSSRPGRRDPRGARAPARQVAAARSAKAAERIHGHERQRCGMEHPLVGHLRCGDWLLFVGIHDSMHLEQLHRLVEADAAAASG